MKTTTIFDETSQQLVYDIAFFRDVANDFKDDKHSLTLTNLEQSAYDLLGKNIELKAGGGRVKTAVVGNFNAGKSSVINSLLGRPVCPVKVNPTTSSITRFIYSDKEIIVRTDTGKTISHQEYFDLCQHKTGKTEETKTLTIDFKYPFDGFRNIELFDTPGFKNTKNSYDEEISKSIASSADVILLVIDINSGEIDADLQTILQSIKAINNNIQLYLIANHADNKAPEARKKIMASFKKKYSDVFTDFFQYSAKEILENQTNSLDDILNYVKTQLLYETQKGNSEFTISLCAQKKGRIKARYSIQIGDSEHLVENTEPSLFLKNKNDIVTLLETIGDNKNNVILENYKNSFKEYKQARKEQITLIRTLCGEGLGRKDIDDDSALEKSYNELQIWLKAEERKKLDGLLNLNIHTGIGLVLKCKEASQEEQSYIFTPYAKIEFNKDYFLSHIIPYRLQLENILKTYAQRLKNEIGFPDCLDNFEIDFFEINKNFVFVLREFISEYHTTNFAHIFYEDIKDAEKNRPAVFEQLLISIKNALGTLTDDGKKFFFLEKNNGRTLNKPATIYIKKYNNKIQNHIGKTHERNVAAEKLNKQIIKKIDDFLKNVSLHDQEGQNQASHDESEKEFKTEKSEQASEKVFYEDENIITAI